MPKAKKKGAPSHVIPFPDRRHPKYHRAAGFVWVAAWAVLNGGRVFEVEVTGERPFWHLGFNEDPDPMFRQFYAGTATVDPVALARTVNELMGMVYHKLPPGLALPDQMARAPVQTTPPGGGPGTA